MKGILYGVSIGVGDPELLTLKAVKTLERCDVIAYPKTKSGRAVALETAQKAVDLSQKELLPLAFLMTRDEHELTQNYKRLAQELADILDCGKDIAMPVLGDVSVYSTFSYIAELLQKSGYRTESIPGVCSPCACAAAAGEPLVKMSRQLHIIPASADIQDVFEFSGVKVVMKSGREISKLIKLLDEKDMLEKAVFIENCGMDNERILRGKEALETEFGYLTTAIIKE